jgi:hypothetical protein
MLAAAHQGKLHLVLYVFDMDRPRRAASPFQRLYDVPRQSLDGIVNAPRLSRPRTLYGEERLGDGDRDLARLEGREGTIPPNDLECAILFGFRRRFHRMDERLQ